MSFFGKLFGKASDKDPVSTGEAIQKLRETEEMLMKKQVGLDKKYVQRYLMYFDIAGFLREEN